MSILQFVKLSDENHWLAAVSLFPHNCQVTQAVQVELMSDLGFSLPSPEQKREVTEALLLTAQHPIRPPTVSWLLGTGGGFTEGEKVVSCSHFTEQSRVVNF